VVRQAHLTAVAGAFVIGCAVLLLVSCAGTRSETSMGQGPTEATKKDQTRPPEATAPKEARCEGTRTLKKPNMAEGVFTTNDLPGCPKGGLLSGTDKHDTLAGEDGEDEIRGLGTGDFIFGGPGNDVIYGGAGRDNPLVGDEGDDVIYGGDGDDAVLIGDEGNDVIYGGPGNDIELHGDGDGQRDKLYCGEGRDSYMAEKVDYVSSSCEVKVRPSKSKGIP
jgi:RTX calcium-binding nonapeptide repeat (4 copies)